MIHGRQSWGKGWSIPNPAKARPRLGVCGEEGGVGGGGARRTRGTGGRVVPAFPNTRPKPQAGRYDTRTSRPFITCPPPRRSSAPPQMRTRALTSRPVSTCRPAPRAPASPPPPPPPPHMRPRSSASARYPAGPPAPAPPPPPSPPPPPNPHLQMRMLRHGCALTSRPFITCSGCPLADTMMMGMDTAE